MVSLQEDSTELGSGGWAQESPTFKRYKDAQFLRGRREAADYRGRDPLDLFLEDTTSPEIPEVSKPATVIKDFCGAIDWKTFETDLEKQTSPFSWLHEQAVDDRVGFRCRSRLTASDLLNCLGSSVRQHVWYIGSIAHDFDNQPLVRT